VGKRARPLSRNALSAVFLREGTHFACGSLIFYVTWTMPWSCLTLGCANVVNRYVLLVEDEGSRVELTASSWADQREDRKRDQDLKHKVPPFLLLMIMTRFCSSFVMHLVDRWQFVLYLLVSVQLNLHY
jgi:hypothetical protein